MPVPARLAIFCLLFATGCAGVAAAPAAPPETWRGGWLEGFTEPEKIIAAARETGFNALMIGAPPDKLEAFARLARESGIDVYYSLTAVARGADAEFAQQMTAAEEAAWATKDKPLYQWGGEPVAFREGRDGPPEVLSSRLLCFHRPEAVEIVRKRARETLEACPSVSGIAYDFFGYQNYRFCECPHSRAAFEAWRAARPGLAAGEAEAAFALETLVAFNNEMSAYIRTLRPEIRIATHVYPVFLPEPLHGNRLDVDYACQTVAWFFEPYWPADKIARYTRAVTGEGAKFFPSARGIPFIGVYVKKPFADKPVERFAAELDTIFTVTGRTDLNICPFNPLVDYPEYRATFLEAVARHERRSENGKP